MSPSPVVRRRAGAVALAAVAVALVWLLLSGGGEPEEEAVVVDGSSAGATTPDAAPDAPTVEPDPPGKSANEDLVDGVILAGFEGDDAGGVLEMLDSHAYGGVLVGPANWSGKGPGSRLLGRLREGLVSDGGGPLFVTAQEGGEYRTLPDLPPAEREIEIGDRGDPAAATRWARDAAEGLRRAGFDLNLAPVADVATLDSSIADRAFSDDPSVAAEMTAAAVEGCASGGMACAVAHFPGLGAASQDTDLGPASIGLDSVTFQSRDLLPFRAAFRSGAPAVVVSHGLYAAFDPVTPASLSRPITTGLLRDDLGFEGVAISDDLGAGAIGAVTDPGTAAVQAVDAGIDLVQVANPADVESVRKALEAAVEDGTLSEDRLAEAGERIAQLSESLG